jgi:hypothetical protein
MAEWHASTPVSSMFSLKISHTNYWKYTQKTCPVLLFDVLCSAPTEEKGTTSQQPRIQGIEEGRAASKVPHSKFGYFLSSSQQVVSADIT